MLTAVLALLIVGCDQASKFAASRLLNPGQSLPVIDRFFYLTLVHNRGMAFGLFPRQNALFLLLSLLTIFLLLLFYRRLFSQGRLFQAAAGLILGGAGGNLIDRVRHSYVVDFLDFDFFDINIAPFRILFFYFPGYHLERWPAFNIADSAICVGVALLIGLALFRKKVSAQRATKTPSIS